MRNRPNVRWGDFCHKMSVTKCHFNCNKKNTGWGVWLAGKIAN